MSSAIEGVEITSIRAHADSRGRLIELFRIDSLPRGMAPAMAYISFTHPGIARGPHEHRYQTDGFAFVDGQYELHLWENRPGRPNLSEKHAVGAENPVVVIVPPGVVHAYRNVGDSEAFVLNFPDRLYAGPGRTETVDEIRHEGDEGSEFKI